MMDLISVVVPIYNTESYLDKCIGSIVNQRYSNLEIILVDDGSTDNSLDICRKWERADRRIVVLHQENQGLSAARNTGIRTAKGKFIGLVDSDDYIAPDMYLRLYRAITDMNADVAICSFAYRNEDGPALVFDMFNPLSDTVMSPETIINKNRLSES